MNITKKIITVASVLCSYSSFAQQVSFTAKEQSEIHSKFIKSAAYIFEGKVISQECFSGGGRWGVLTCSVIQITKIYKGSPQIKLGTIKVITSQGGHLPNETIEAAEFDGGGVALDKGGSYIILGNNAPSTMLHTMQADNDVTVTDIGNDNPVYFNRGNPVWGQTRYTTQDSLYSFFRVNGLTIQDQIGQTQQPNSPSDSTKH